MVRQWQFGRRGHFDSFKYVFMSDLHEFSASTEWDSWSDASDFARADSPSSDTDTLVLSQMSIPLDTPRASDYDSSTMEGWSTPESEGLLSFRASSRLSSLSATSQEYVSDEDWSVGDEHIEYEPAQDEETSRSAEEFSGTAPDMDGEVASSAESQRAEASEDNCPLSPARLAVKRPATDVDLEAACCSICLDAWAGGGRHRVVALGCGHVFGDSCIRRWLRKGASPRCPTCKIIASVGTLRRLRPALVSSPDARELREELARARAESRRATVDLARAVSDQADMTGEVQKLKEQLKLEQESTAAESSGCSVA